MRLCSWLTVVLAMPTKLTTRLETFFCSTQAEGEAPSLAVENVQPEVTFQRKNEHLQVLTIEGAPGICRWLQQRFVFSQTVGPLQDKPEAMCNKKRSSQYFWYSEMLTSASVSLANFTPNWSKSNSFRVRWKISICTGDPRLGGRGGPNSLGYRESQASAVHGHELSLQSLQSYDGWISVDLNLAEVEEAFSLNPDSSL